MTPDPFAFRLLRTDGGARLGEFETPHGVVRTPAFMPVGTQGAVKGTLFKDLEDAGAGLSGGTITTAGTIGLAAIADDRVLANVSGGSAPPSEPIAASTPPPLHGLPGKQGTRPGPSRYPTRVASGCRPRSQA